MSVVSDLTDAQWSAFLRDQQLPDTFRAHAKNWFLPLLDAVVRRLECRDTPLLLGINGAQGSGKSTLAAFMAMALSHHADASICVLSIDDFYLTLAQRHRLARDVHPLLASRGVPGTHDTDLMSEVIGALCQGAAGVSIPRFDKARDDRAPRAYWDRIGEPVDIVVLEGWCVGLAAQPVSALTEPINPLEQHDDAQAVWRTWVNERLQNDYQSLFSSIDCLVLLAAPDFSCVHRWRAEQEQKLIARQGDKQPGVMNGSEIERFIQHFQRLTEWGLRTLPDRADYLFQLGSERQILSLSSPTAGVRP